MTRFWRAALAVIILCLCSVARAESQFVVCDRLAASPDDPTRPPSIAGVGQYEIGPVKAMAACQAAYAESGHAARYAFQLGRAFEAEVRMKEAIALYREAAAAGHVAAMVYLGMALEESNAKEAFGWYAKSAELGNALAQYRLGSAYHWGIGTEVNAVLAIEWYRKASDGGSALAAEYLGHLYSQGELMPRDMKQAIHYYELGIARGDTGSMYSLAYIYEKGIGVPVNRPEAYRIYMLAAAYDDDEARAMAEMLLFGPFKPAE